jgi:ATP-dependent HslUV protease ATP-binding subunit HslU
MKGQKVTIDEEFVEKQLSKIITNLDLAKFVL